VTSSSSGVELETDEFEESKKEDLNQTVLTQGKQVSNQVSPLKTTPCLSSIY